MIIKHINIVTKFLYVQIDETLKIKQYLFF